MKEIIYHGSKNKIVKPEYGKGKPYNDYGLGLYCTWEKDMAKEWSVSRDSGGYVNEYNIDSDGLRVLNLNTENYTVLNWLSILLENRYFDARSDFANEAGEYLLKEFKPDYEDMDIIIGYRADDSYFSFAQDFINNAISLRTLANAMSLGKLGLQYVVKSKEAFERLNFISHEYVPNEEWFIKKEQRDQQAREQYRVSRRQARSKDDIYMLQILNEEMKADDLRL